MSLQTTRSRKWSTIVAASSDRVANRASQLYRTHSKNNSSILESETMEVAKPNTVSDQEFSSQEIEDPNQSDIYDEKVYTEALKDINSELESLRSLYNSQWFTDIRKSLDKNRNQVAHAERQTNTVTTDQLPGKILSKSDLHLSKYHKNTSITQNTTPLKPTALLQQLQSASALQRDLDELDRMHNILPTHHEKQLTDDVKYHQNTSRMQNITALKPTTLPQQLQSASALQRDLDELDRMHKILPTHHEKQLTDDAKYHQNTSRMQNTTALKPTKLFQQFQSYSALQRDLDELDRVHKILPTHHENQLTDDVKFNKVIEIPENAATPADVLTGLVNHASKKAVNTMNVISEARKDENKDNMLRKDTQNKFSSLDNKQLYSNFTQMLCEVDKITNELKEVECQSFKDALEAVNEEVENKETHASKKSATLTLLESRCSLSTSKVRSILQKYTEKRSPGSSYSRAKTNTEEINRKISEYKMPDSAILCNTRVPKKVHNTPLDKQKKSGAEREKKKGAICHSLKSTKQLSLVYSLSDDNPPSRF